MKHNGYLIVSSILNEMPIGRAYKQGAKTIFRNLKKDPISVAVMATPFPGAIETGTAMHMMKNKRSRDVGRVLLRKTFNRRRWKH